MPSAFTHFLIGAIGTTVLATLVFPTQSFPRSTVVLGGIWSLIPDIHWMVPGFNPMLRIAHRSFLANIFWFHQFMDRHELLFSRSAEGLLVTVLTVVTLAADRWNTQGAD